MKEQKIIHVFDVDGTLTHHDTLLLLLKHFTPSFTKRMMLWLSIIPIVIPAILQGKGWKIKQALLGRLWKGWQQETIVASCTAFFNEMLKTNLREKSLQHIAQLKQNDPDLKIVLLSASCTEWLSPLAGFLKADLICTELQYDNDNLFTGRFATPNCKGKEKKRRLVAKYPADKYEFISYGNTKSDKQLQSVSRQFYYRYF